MNYLQLSAFLLLAIFNLQLAAMQTAPNNPLTAVSTALFKKLHKEPISDQEIRDAANQFKTYRAIRNSPPLPRKNTPHANRDAK